MLYVNAKYECLFNRLWKHQETLNSFSITSPNLIAVMGQPWTLPQPTGDLNHTIFQLFNRKYSSPFIALLGLPVVFLSSQSLTRASVQPLIVKLKMEFQINVLTNAAIATRLSNTSITWPNTDDFTLARNRSSVQNVSSGFPIRGLTVSTSTIASPIASHTEIKRCSQRRLLTLQLNRYSTAATLRHYLPTV